LLLADVAQARGDWTGVEQRLSLIPADDDVNYRRAVALGKQGRTEEALRLLEPAEATAQDEAADSRKNSMNMKVRWLREFDRTADAYELSAEMMSAFPDDIDVMYGHAMLAEQLKRHDEMERLLRAVIAKKPDYAHAYNALGYAWVDRGVRLAEAQALIEEALKRSPNDPLITDSLGWAYYRQGQLTLAARTLQKAYSLKQDPEIAAHLGEVWWKLGQTESAEKLLRDAVARYPSNSVLKDTIKRLGLAL
jgi:tetratricopeptide (TPR) repeat protein